MARPFIRRRKDLMFICDDSQFVYVSFTKSCSSSMYNLLQSNFKGLRTKRSWRKIPDQYVDYTSFCVVRNPYSRLVSWWWSICKVGGDRYGHIKELTDLGLTTTLEDFLTLWDTKNGLGQAFIVEDVNRMDHIIKLENIEEEFNALPFINNHISIPKVNVKNKPHWRELITPKAAQKIETMYKRDFELFNYKIEDFS